jgi:hypothetical protein
MKLPIDDLYKVIMKYNTREISCQTLPGLSHYGMCPDKHILMFNEFGPQFASSFINLISSGIDPKCLSEGQCYQIKQLPLGKTIETLDETELKQHYRLICFNCSQEHYINQLKINNREEFDKIVYMDVDRQKENVCKGITARSHLCKNPANVGSYFCSSHKDQKVDGINTNTNFTFTKPMY